MPCSVYRTYGWLFDSLCSPVHSIPFHRLCSLHRVVDSSTRGNSSYGLPSAVSNRYRHAGLEDSISASDFLKLRSKMLQCLRKSALKNSKKTNIRQHAESYHSYPDPTEVPEVSSTVSSFKKTCDKSSNGFSIDQKFRLDRSFTSTQTKSAPGNRSRPEPASTTISNGIVVSSIDTPGLMTSFSLLVQTGR